MRVTAVVAKNSGAMVLHIDIYIYIIYIYIIYLYILQIITFIIDGYVAFYV